MAYTVSNAIMSALMRIGQLNISKATGGSTTTVVDTTIDPENQEDDAYKNGLLVVVRDSAGASAAPEGEFNRISAFVADTGTFTVESALTAAVASGDTYGYTSPNYTLNDMKRLLNEALQELGDMPFIDTTTLDTVAGDTEYAAALAWKRRKPYRIDFQTKTGDAQDNQWKQIYDWEWVPAAAGSTGKIIFARYPIGSRDIRVWYKDRHPIVDAYSDAINERIDPELVARALVYQIRNWEVERDDGGDQTLMQKWNKAKSELNESKVDRPIERPKRQSKLLILGHQDYDYDEFKAPDPA